MSSKKNYDYRFDLHHPQLKVAVAVTIPPDVSMLEGDSEDVSVEVDNSVVDDSVVDDAEVDNSEVDNSEEDDSEDDVAEDVDTPISPVLVVIYAAAEVADV